MPTAPPPSRDVALETRFFLERFKKEIIAVLIVAVARCHRFYWLPLLFRSTRGGGCGFVGQCEDRSGISTGD